MQGCFSARLYILQTYQEQGQACNQIKFSLSQPFFECRRCEAKGFWKSGENYILRVHSFSKEKQLQLDELKMIISISNIFVIPLSQVMH
jgi:hypothetical protein